MAVTWIFSRSKRVFSLWTTCLVISLLFFTARGSQEAVKHAADKRQLLSAATAAVNANDVANAAGNVAARASSKGRFAYVTVHYEGTNRDEEYVLGVQVLMQSIKLTNTPYDLIVLASDSVTEKSKQIFRSIGCRVIEVDNIENPFANRTLTNKNFIFTLNKLHIWNLLEYERVVYLDADNVLIRNADELFLCGHFCAAFMNPCHFHTGLLVVSPDRDEYRRLLKALDHSESFDGADQGFLSHIYSQDLRRSPLFVPSKVKKLSQLPNTMRLPVGYNINHKYFYEQYHWKLFYLRHFASMTSAISPVHVVVESARPIPAVTLGYPMAPVLKPWYWSASFWMDLHQVWHDIRATIPPEQERFGSDEILNTVFKVMVSLAWVSLVLFGARKYLPVHLLQRTCTTLQMQHQKTAKLTYLGFRIVLILIAAKFAPSKVHRFAPQQLAFTLTIAIHFVVLVYMACCISYFWNIGPCGNVSAGLDVDNAPAKNAPSYYSTPAYPITGQQTLRQWLPPVCFYREFWLYASLLIVTDVVLLWVSGLPVYPNVVWRLVVIFAVAVGCGAYEVFFFKVALQVEFSGKKDRLRSK